MNNEIIVLCGKSSVGKDTLADELKKEGYNFITSHSTRPMREGESEGNPYYFITKEEMLEYIDNDELVEYRTYNTNLDGKADIWYYSVHKSEIQDDKKYVVVLDINGLKDFKEIYGDRVISFNLHMSDKIREERAKERGGFCQIEWNRRLEADGKDFRRDLLHVTNCTLTTDHSVEDLSKKVIELVNKSKKLEINKSYVINTLDQYTLMPSIKELKLLFMYNHNCIFKDKNYKLYNFSLPTINFSTEEELKKYKFQAEVEAEIERHRDIVQKLEQQLKNN